MRLVEWLRAEYRYHVRKLVQCEDCPTLIPRRRSDQMHYYHKCGPCLERFARRCEAASGMRAMIDPAALPR